MSAHQVIVMLVACGLLRLSYALFAQALGLWSGERRTRRLGRLNSFWSAGGAAGDRQSTQRLPLGWVPVGRVIDVRGMEVR